MFTWLKLGTAFAIGALAAGATAYNIGYGRGEAAGYARARGENLQAAFDQLKERQETDAEISTMDDAGLCALLDGELRDGACQ